MQDEPPSESLNEAVGQVAVARVSESVDTATGARPKTRPLSDRDWPIAALLALSVALWLLGDRQQAGANPELVLYGASGLAWYLVGILLIAWVASRASVPKAAYRQSLLLVSACGPPAVMLLWSVSAMASEKLYALAALLVALIGAGVLAWGLRRSTGKHQVPAVWLALMVAVGFGWLSDALYVRPGVWYAQDAEGTAEYQSAWKDGERLLFEQPDRIDRAVGQIGTREPGRPNAYFVGFAGFGGQKVFAEEIKLASRVIGMKYGSMTRSVRLVNDRRNLRKFPLATASGLRRTLREIGKRMDRSDDILFLVLSSHGSEGAELAVENGGLPLRQLRGTELADALRDAGIQWKVVVISACFAGGFIDALKDDYSIVLTAAAADRTSFGCADDRDLTYFGEAFFRDALPDATSLREAFTRARQDIDAREIREGVEPSDPQAFFGSQIEKHMGQLGYPDLKPLLRSQ
jgi:hypothetical protein